MALKFLSASGSGSLAGAVTAINYMVMMKERGVNIRVSNNSWGGGGYSQPLYDAIKRARDAGIVFAAAAGNESNDNDASASYPAGYDLDNIVSVAAIDQSKNLASFSNYGLNSVDIAAPGVSILSTVPGNRYDSYSGTSMATPHVAGAIALLAGHEPWLNYQGLIARMYDSGVDAPTVSGLVRTGRALDAARMLHGQTAPIPATPVTPIPCSYSMNEINYAPDLSVDSQPIVLQADEFSSYAFSLPFAFPFHNESISTIYISPNGVVYTKSAPSAMDYRNSTRAPKNSIAALHTDLIAKGDPYGVRVVADATHATIYWLAENYDTKGRGYAQVRLTLYSDGTIDDSIAFSTSKVKGAIIKAATVGLAGSGRGSTYTYAYNSTQIKNHLSVRFTPECSSTVAVSNVKLRGVAKGGKQTTTAVPGSAIRLTISGQGSGVTQFQASFDGRSCGSSVPISVVNGTAKLTGKISSLAREFAEMSVSVQGASGSAKIKRQSGVKRKSRAKLVSAKRLSSVCASLYRTLK